MRHGTWAFAQTKFGYPACCGMVSAPAEEAGIETDDDDDRQPEFDPTAVALQLADRFPTTRGGKPVEVVRKPTRRTTRTAGPAVSYGTPKNKLPH